MKPTLFLSLLLALTARAENWPTWRGPTGQGISTEKHLPLRWSTNQNVKWRIPLPEPGNSTPIVWRNRLFLTQAIDNKRVLTCYNRDDGALLWQVGPTWSKTDLTHDTNPQSSASPVTDGQRVIAFFGSAGIFCYDFNGNLLWQRDLGEQRHIWGYGSSPTIHENTVYLNFGPGPRQTLYALGKNSGNILWQKDEPGGNSGEATSSDKAIWAGSWSTPLIVKASGKDQLLLSWPERLASYNPKTGAELWTCSGLNPLAYTSPLYANGLAVAMGGFGGKDLAVTTDGSGDVTATHRIWHHPKTKQRIGTGAIHNGHIYIHTDPGVAECINLKTGVTIWEERLKGPGATGVNWSSVMIADGNCYTINQSGDCFVFKASPRFEVVSTNSLHEPSNSSIVPSEGQLFIRTHKALWCITNNQTK